MELEEESQLIPAFQRRFRQVYEAGKSEAGKSEAGKREPEALIPGMGPSDVYEVRYLHIHLCILLILLQTPIPAITNTYTAILS
jgi:hypothetical protein